MIRGSLTIYKIETDEKETQKYKESGRNNNIERKISSNHFLCFGTQDMSEAFLQAVVTI